MSLSPQTAISISTADWNRIIDYLKDHHWKLKKQYLGFDKGIDYDFYHFQKEKQDVKLAWCNWFEGEMQTSSSLFNLISTDLSLSFLFGEAEHL
ncbi:MAG: hypothetical protein LBI72_05485 [Flavobacteriaceae bacterium]|jgi:hypothetical protein|nr:hypothetical protein [Flavobacteriaceae bacterium]